MALTAVSVPIRPPAPPRLSTTSGLPRRSPSCWPITRATMSLLPPGGNGTISRIGRLG
jgi:hypothetical protein